MTNESQKSQNLPKNDFESELVRTNTDFNEVIKIEELAGKKDQDSNSDIYSENSSEQ